MSSFYPPRHSSDVRSPEEGGWARVSPCINRKLLSVSLLDTRFNCLGTIFLSHSGKHAAARGNHERAKHVSIHPFVERDSAGENENSLDIVRIFEFIFRDNGILIVRYYMGHEAMWGARLNFCGTAKPLI